MTASTTVASGSAIARLALALLLAIVADATATTAENVTELVDQSMDVLEVVEEQQELEMKEKEMDQVESSTIGEVEDQLIDSSNVSSSVNRTETGFMPSVHLGPIIGFPEQSADHQYKSLPIRTLFNKVEAQQQQQQQQQQLEFGSGSRSNSPFNSVRAIKFESGSEDAFQSQQQQQRKQQQQQSHFRPSDQDTSYVKFVDHKDHDDERRHYQHDHQANRAREQKVIADTRHSGPSLEHQQQQQQQQRVVTYVDENYDSGHHLHQQQQRLQLQQPQQLQYVTFDTKPSKFHEAPAYAGPYQQNLLAGDNNAYAQYPPNQHESYQNEDSKLVQPDPVINVHPMSYQTTSFDAHTKPKTVVYVTTHETTRTRKFPYQYYQPQIFEHTEAAPLALPDHVEPYQYPLYYEQQPKSVSPWKKILHIIGAFLPLGLLVALLSPKVVTTDQNTDPNIVLSKLRVNDLQAEHKNNRLVPPQLQVGDDECEERSICKLIIAADATSSNFLRQLLVHVVQRTPESAVRKKELDRIFEAAQLGNCDIWTCNFYDGT